MASLKEIVLADEKRAVVFSDVRSLLDLEVKKRGITIKMGYKIVRTFKSGFLDKVIQDLVPEFCEALEPLHVEHVDGETNGTTFGQYMLSNEDQVTMALISVTDGKAAKSRNRVIKKTYKRLRSSAERNVRAAIPGLADLMDKHYDD